MSDFLYRLVIEKAELDAKRSKLDAFRTTDTFADLDMEERCRLDLQVVYMEFYSEILGERIAWHQSRSNGK